MINQQQFSYIYPNLVKFSDPNSPTYTRRSRKGKTVLVRKGKRKKGKANLAALGGLVAAPVVAGGGTYHLAKKALGKAKVQYPLQMGGAALAGGIAAGVALNQAGRFIRKKTKK